MTAVAKEKINVPGHISSLLQICPEEMSQPIYELCRLMPKMVRMSEASIRKKAKPNEVLDRLRLAFWDEVNRSILQGKPFRLNQVIRGCCSRRQFFANYVANRYQLMWVVTPPKSYALAMRQVLSHSIKELERIVQAPVTDHIQSSTRLESLGLIIRMWELGAFNAWVALDPEININR